MAEKKPKSAKAKLLEAVLVTESAYLPSLMMLLEHATESVELIAYSFAIGSASGKLSAGAPMEVAEKLAGLAKRGVKVRVYLEGQRDTFARNEVTGKWLKKHGIAVVYGASHAKGFCVDHQFLLFGSTNLTNQSITKNNETNLVISDRRVVKGFLAYFEHLWKGGSHGGITLKDPLYADGAFKPMLLKLIQDAKTSLEFSIYFFDQKEISQALIAAHNRGVKITGFIHNHFAFAMPYVHRTRRTARLLLGAGIRGLKYGPTHLFTHSKYLIQDGETIALGTGNWLDEDVKTHPQLYVRVENPALAKKLGAHLKRQMKNSGTRPPRVV